MPPAGATAVEAGVPGGAAGESGVGVGSLRVSSSEGGSPLSSVVGGPPREPAEPGRDSRTGAVIAAERRQ